MIQLAMVFVNYFLSNIINSKITPTTNTLPMNPICHNDIASNDKKIIIISLIDVTTIATEIASNSNIIIKEIIPLNPLHCKNVCNKNLIFHTMLQ